LLRRRKMAVLKTVSIVLAAVIFSRQTEAGSSDSTSALVRKLIANADPIVRPDSDIKPTVVSVGYCLNGIEETKKSSVLVAHGFTVLSWNDPRLTWSESGFENITTATLPISAIWAPDLTFYNSANAQYEAFSGGQKLALVYRDGTVIWVPKTSVKFRSTNSKKGNEKTATLLLGSWVYSASQIDLKSTSSTVDTGYFDWSGDYVLKNSSITYKNAVYPGIPDAYPRLEINLSIEKSD